MAGFAALALTLFAQDAVQAQVDDALARFQAAAQVDQAAMELLAQLSALGAAAATPIGRRLAEDLRDGMASTYAPALIDALAGQPEGLVPLQQAFRDAATPVPGRIQIADALTQLHETASWRSGLTEILADPRVDLGDRLRAGGLLLRAGPPPDELRRMLEGLAERAVADQKRIVEFLLPIPEARELVAFYVLHAPIAASLRRAAARALLKADVYREEALEALDEIRREEAEEPRVQLEDAPVQADRRSAAPPPRRAQKVEDSDAGSGTILIASGAALLAALVWTILRKD